jgi:hypothetical protein
MSNLPPPPPMPSVRPALQHLQDAKVALERPAWSASQVEDQIRSAEFFISKAKLALQGGSAP